MYIALILIYHSKTKKNHTIVCLKKIIKWTVLPMSMKKGVVEVLLVIVARSFLKRPMYDSIQWRLSGN